MHILPLAGWPCLFSHCTAHKVLKQAVWYVAGSTGQIWKDFWESVQAIW